MLYHLEQGGGRPLVLLHGFLNDGQTLAAYFETFSRHFRIIVPDLRGQGKSARLSGPYTPRHMAEDLAELLTSLGVGPVDIFAFSLGGAVALELARTQPQLVGRIVIVSGFAHRAGSAGEEVFSWLQPVLLRLIGIRRLSAWLPRLTGNHDAEMLRWQRYLSTQRTRQLAAIMREMNRFDARTWTSGIRQPVLVIGGNNDRFVPPRNARELASLLPNATLEILPDGDHSALNAKSAEISRLTLRFLR